MVWIGGAPGAGKSTIARELARRGDLPLHPIVNLPDLLIRLLLTFVVLNQQSCDRRAQRRLSSLQCQPDLPPSLMIVAFRSQSEHPVHRIPELCQRSRQELSLFRSSVGWRKLLF